MDQLVLRLNLAATGFLPCILIFTIVHNILSITIAIFNITMIKIFSRFYNAMAGPTLILNTTQFGHADLLDELEAGANEVFFKYSKKKMSMVVRRKLYSFILFLFLISFNLIFQIIRFCKADKDSDKYSYRFHFFKVLTIIYLEHHLELD